MRDAVPQVTNLKDYTPPAFRISRVALDVDIEPGEVTDPLDSPGRAQRRQRRRRPSNSMARASSCFPWRSMAGRSRLREYKVDGTQLTIAEVPDAFTLETVVRFDPWKNTKLEGLYATDERLRHAVRGAGLPPHHLLHRPPRRDGDATRSRCAPTRRSIRCCSSNGNLVVGRRPPPGWFKPGGRHWARWEDPFPKPSYLFALVAGEPRRARGPLHDALGQESPAAGLRRARQARPGGLRDAVAEAVHALGRGASSACELDLERFMIVAVGDFNLGAMENKGLNIFNTKYVLARPDTATDYDYFAHRRVVAPRVLPQLDRQPRHLPRLVPALAQGRPDGLPRPGVQRRRVLARPWRASRTCASLRSRQFPEDAGPMAHPVRPDSLRRDQQLLHRRPSTRRAPRSCACTQTLLGKEGFRHGMDLYFQRHDGQAVTCDDFRAAMADANDAGPRAVRALVLAGRHAGARMPRRIRRQRGDLHAAREAIVPADAGTVRRRNRS